MQFMPNGCDAVIHCVYCVLEKNILTFVETELQNLKSIASLSSSEDSEDERMKEDKMDSEVGERRKSSREAFLKIILQILREMDERELADSLQNSKRLNIMWRGNCDR